MERPIRMKPRSRTTPAREKRRRRRRRKEEEENKVEHPCMEISR
jgi:hypothetical protein